MRIILIIVGSRNDCQQAKEETDVKTYLVIFGVHLRTHNDSATSSYERTVRCEPGDLQKEISKTKASLESKCPAEAEMTVSVTQVLPLD